MCLWWHYTPAAHRRAACLTAQTRADVELMVSGLLNYLGVLGDTPALRQTPVMVDLLGSDACEQRFSLHGSWVASHRALDLAELPRNCFCSREVPSCRSCLYFGNHGIEDAIDVMQRKRF